VPNTGIQRALAKDREYAAIAQNNEFHRGRIASHAQGLTKRKGILTSQKLESQLPAALES